MVEPPHHIDTHGIIVQATFGGSGGDHIMNLRGYTADHRFRELALSLVVTRGPLLSSRAINQLEKRQKSFCQPYSTLAKTEERRRMDKIPPFSQRTREREVCTICKPQDQWRAGPQDKRPYTTDKYPRSRIQPRQDHITAAKPVADHRRTGGARTSATGMEDSLRNLSLNDVKEENMSVK